MPDKIPPQNTEAETGLLGSLMLDKNAIIKVVDFMRPNDFYKPVHQEIYKAMAELFDRKEPIDLLSLGARLKEKNKLEEIGSNSYLTELVNSVPTASNAMNYAKIVQKKAILRNMISVSHDIGIMGYDENEDTDILLDNAEKKIFNISQKSLNQNFVHIKETLEKTFDRIDALSKHKEGLRGLSTGFVEIDNKLAGLQKSDLIILAARPSLGKSALAMDIARHVAVNDKKSVGIFSLEMSKDQISDRMLSAVSFVDFWKLRTGRKLSSEGSDNDFIRIQQSLDKLYQAPIFIDDAAISNILQMRAMARRLQAEHGLGLLIVDYLQLMEPRNINASMVQQMTEVSRSLKALARELDVPVLALSQLSRGVEQRTPQVPRLSDLRETGAIEQDADVVMFIHRPDKYRDDAPKNVAEIIIAKHRNGPLGMVKLMFNENLVSFRNLAKQEEEAQQQSTF